jgi:hypothetical protein
MNRKQEVINVETEGTARSEECAERDPLQYWSPVETVHPDMLLIVDESD